MWGASHEAALASLREEQELALALQASTSSAQSEQAARDEQLARRLQAEEEAAAQRSLPPPPRPAPAKPASRWPLMGGLFGGGGAPSAPLLGGSCAGCGGGFGFGTVLTALGREWHPPCFTCSVCGLPVTSRVFSLSPDGGRPCHAECYAARHAPRCEACGDVIPADGGGTVRYLVSPFWQEKLCLRCEHGASRCAFCRRVERRGGPAHAPAPNGSSAMLCLPCVSSSVGSEADALPLYHSVAAFFAAQGAPLPYLPPLRVVAPALLRALRSTALTAHADEPDEATLGLCLSTERTMSLFGAELSRSVAIEAIAVRELLPRLLMGRVLAHELCHAHLRLNGATRLTPVVEEGTCELWSLLFLEHALGAEQQSGGGEEGDLQFAAFLADATRTNTSPVYGGGVRAALASYQRCGLAALMHAVRTTGRLP